MTFWLLIILMIVLSLFFALRPLLFRNIRQNSKDDQARVRVYRLRLSELAENKKKRCNHIDAG